MPVFYNTLFPGPDFNFGGVGGNTASAGVAYDLISEGEIELVGGLAGIYLNRTPISNTAETFSVQSNVINTALYNPATFFAVGNITGGNTVVDNVPIIVFGGAKVGTVTEQTGSSITASAGFFDDTMINGATGSGFFAPKIRIENANSDGSEYVGTVSSRDGNTATLFPPPPSNLVNKSISFDFYTTCNMLYINYVTSVSLAASVPIYTTFPDPAPSVRVLIQNISSNIPGASTDNKNFKFVLANFRGGTVDQDPVNMPAFTNASLGININRPIKQHTDYFNIPLSNFWRKKHTLKRPSGATGGSVETINSSEIAPGSPNEIDELLLTISAPSGLYDADAEGDARVHGAVFQIFFTYSNGSVTKTVQIYGPTDAEINKPGYFPASFFEGTFYDGGPTPSGTIRSSSKSSVDFDFRWSIEEFKPFDNFQVVIKKVTPDALEYNNDRIIADTSVKSLQAFISDKLAYPYAAYAAIAFDSLEFTGEFPERAYRCRGVRSDIPTNYVTREEAPDGVASYNRTSSGTISSNYQIWDGSFRRDYTNNPIWNLRELLLNKRWGLGHWVTEDMINDYSFYSLARYCDELVPDGTGGLEPRFTCGVYLTEPVESYKIIRDFCTTMLALPYWVDGQLILEADRPAEPVYTFTKGNIEGGLFSYEGTGNKTRPNQIAVKYNNKDNFYEPDLELVDDVEDMIKNNRIFVEETTAFGATTRGQAVRYGKWKLLTSKLQKEIVSFKTGENATYLKPGSIINIQDADKNSVRYSGRLINASSTSSVQVDSPVILNSNEDYTLHVLIEGPATYLVQDSVTFSAGQIGTEATFVRGDQLPGIITVPINSEELASKIVDKDGNPVDVQFVNDAHIESKPINKSTSTSTNLVVTSAFTSIPVTETVWAITVKREGALVEGSAKQYKILSIGEEAEGVYSITAAEHFNSKFDLIDENYLATAPRSVPRYIDIPQVTNFAGKLVTPVSNKEDTSSNTNVPSILLSWVGPRAWAGNTLTLYQDFDTYELAYTTPSGNTETVTLGKFSTSYTLTNVEEGLYQFTIRAKSSLGPVSAPVRTTISVILTTRKASNLAFTLPIGGSFDRPINLSGGTIQTPSTYRFTADSGRNIYVSPFKPTTIDKGNLWYDSTNNILKQWDAPGWVIDGATYSLSSTAYSVNEGESFTVTLNTTNVANGTSFPYTITGISSADIGGASLTGNFVISNGTATRTITVTADSLLEGPEIFRLSLNNGYDYINVAFADTSIP